MSWVVRGRVWKFGDNISGDDGIIDFSRLKDYTKEYDEAALAQMCMALINPEFPKRVRRGDLVVGGRNFALDNHPQVAIAIKACGVPAVLVESTNVSFIRKSLNVGLGVLTCPGVSKIVSDGDVLEADFATGIVRNVGTGATITTKPFMDMMIQILRAGGLVSYLSNYVAERGGATAQQGQTANADSPVVG